MKKEKKPLKVVLVGDSECGKTSLILSFLGMQMNDEHTPTAFDDFLTEITIAGKTESLLISDTAGSDDYSSLRPLSYPDADVFLVCYAADSPDSLDHSREKWVSEVRRFSDQLPIIFVGLKKELRSLGWEHMAELGVAEVAARQFSEYPVVECSARTKENVRPVFEAATKMARAHRNRQKSRVLQQIMKLKLVF